MEKSYVRWVRRYILFHGKRPAEMGRRDHDLGTTMIHTHVLDRGPSSTHDESHLTGRGAAW